MKTLLILGSKPDPVLPPRSSFDAIACANASGHSAARHGLPDPAITVMSTVLTSGHKPANTLALRALAGLRTRSLYLYPRPESQGGALKRLVREIRRVNVKPWYFKLRLRMIGYHYDGVTAWRRGVYHDLVNRLCDHDPEVAEHIRRKQPSTGVMALVIGLADGRFDRFVMSGFSFEITHAYAHNPLIDELGTTRSKHTDTDIAVLRCLVERCNSIFTTEPTVHERAGVPLLKVTNVDPNWPPAAIAS